MQKTNTIPYILTKQYAISLSSQVLNNVSIDRSQQKQIDEIKTISENKVNASDLGGFKFEKNGNVNTMYVESDLPLISNYDKETSTQATVVGNIDSGLLLCSAQTRPKFTDGFTTSEIALSTDLDDIILRLDDLGFKRGVASINGATATTNPLKKQGKYCIFNLVLESYEIKAQETKTITITIPVGFRPKEETKINFTYFDNIPHMTTLEKFLEITVGTNGIIVISITAGNYGNGIMFPKILNAGWELA